MLSSYGGGVGLLLNFYMALTGGECGFSDDGPPNSFHHCCLAAYVLRMMHWHQHKNFRASPNPHIHELLSINQSMQCTRLQCQQDKQHLNVFSFK